jgi:ABC-type dipeptide/oligopeptide/nickel transport system permease subunit
MMLTQETPVPVKSNKPRIDWAKLFWLLRKSPLTMIGGMIMFLMLALMLTSPWIVPHDPNALDLTARLQALRHTLVWHRRSGPRSVQPRAGGKPAVNHCRACRW